MLASECVHYFLWIIRVLEEDKEYDNTITMC